MYAFGCDHTAWRRCVPWGEHLKQNAKTKENSVWNDTLFITKGQKTSRRKNDTVRNAWEREDRVISQASEWGLGEDSRNTGFRRDSSWISQIVRRMYVYKWTQIVIGPGVGIATRTIMFAMWGFSLSESTRLHACGKSTVIMSLQRHEFIPWHFRMHRKTGSLSRCCA